ncbi:MAG: GntR family transcriptional regulator [Hyphomicrobiales bacterium]|jgi:DNA-binding GntR family transcriptional regulator|nr:GntR family transcriptional regulator [Hyphomicrobiales bacterium]MBV9909145.1 GntR family transcriptional regulator [Hyphomicrobiales bacterium]
MNERDPGAPVAQRERRAFAAIERPKQLHETVVERLRDMIVEGELASGDRLHDANLAKILQVSRTPIREAIKLLATEGLVDLLPGRGARVREMSSEDILDLFETIAGIERHACELAAERMSERDLDKLQRAHKRMARHHAAGERQPYFRLNHEIHLAIVEASKNVTLQAIHASLMSRARRARYAALASQARWMEAMGEHNQIMAALAKRDPGRAGEIMRRHDLGTARSIVAVLKLRPNEGHAASSGPDA